MMFLANKNRLFTSQTMRNIRPAIVFGKDFWNSSYCSNFRRVKLKIHCFETVSTPTKLWRQKLTRRALKKKIVFIYGTVTANRCYLCSQFDSKLPISVLQFIFLSGSLLTNLQKLKTLCKKNHQKCTLKSEAPSILSNSCKRCITQNFESYTKLWKTYYIYLINHKKIVELFRW